MIEYTLPSNLLNYELVDSGGKRKLERFGEIFLIRPEVRARWRPANPAAWNQSRAEYIEDIGWRHEGQAVDFGWEMQFGEINFQCKLGSSKQVGLFPENALQWEWIKSQMTHISQGAEVLNLFGYTGIASLVAARAGGRVTHIDAARPALKAGKANATISGIKAGEIRWLEEDALGFVRREIRRGRRYSGLIIDPPVYGIGPKKERWKLESHLAELCEHCRQLLEPRNSFVVMTVYALEQPPEFLKPFMAAMLPDSGKIEFGELIIPETSAGRKLGVAISARWTSVQPH